MRRLRVSSIVLSACLSLAAGCGGAAPPNGPAPSKSMASLPHFEAQLRKAGLYTGGKPQFFEGVGRGTLATAVATGLDPDDVVVDIGAGSLRVGWWLLNFVDPSNYHAVDPDQERLDQAIELLGVDIHTYYNDDFEFPDVEVDFVIARSIWTHASKAMISTMLSEFGQNASPEGVFLASVLLAQSPEEDYQGEEWVGKGAGKGEARVVKHSLEWIREECGRNRLRVMVGDVLYGHTWMVIRRK